MFPHVDHAPVRIGLCDLDAEKTTSLSDRLLQIFIELPKFASTLDSLHKDDRFLDKFAAMMAEMPFSDKIPDKLDDELLRMIFNAADTKRYKLEEIDDYNKNIMNELEYAATLHEYKVLGISEGQAKGKAEGRAEGRAEVIAKITEAARKMGLSEDQIKVLVQEA